MCASTPVPSSLKELKLAKQNDAPGVADQALADELAIMENEGYYKKPYNSFENLMWFVGLFLLVCFIPWTIVIVASTVLWDFVDRLGMGKPLDGVTFWIAKKVNLLTQNLWKPLVRNPADSFVVNNVLLLGLFIPLLFFGALYHTIEHGFSLQLCFFYHLLRLGPYFTNFAYTYSSCHKECHNFYGIFAKPYHYVLKNVYNWWIGLFYGVLPSTFTFGHAINHHKYNNGPNDVVTTSDKPRDSFTNFVTYLPRQAAYALNISTVYEFASEGDHGSALLMLVGTAYYVFFVAVCWSYDPIFAIMYTIMPLGENILLLACVNWAWHCSLNEKDPEDEYIGSLTILHGPINILEEDYHVIHHVYPGLHWTEHFPKFFRDFTAGHYHKGPATIFQGTHVFEVFFLIILKKYDLLADFMVDPRGIWTKQDKENAIKVRLRTCWWGERKHPRIVLQGKEVRKK